jgi:predicted enzyme related to lactoylglutathione lyase
MSRLLYTIVFTRNFDAMRLFYRERVGFSIRNEQPRWVAFDTAGASLALLDMPDERKQGIALRFEARDLDSELRAVESRGARRFGDVISFAAGRLADFWDPAGNLVQLFEPVGPDPSGSGPAMDRVILNVREFAPTVAFYRDRMGFHVVADAPGWVEFDAGGTRLAVHHRATGDDHPRHAEQPIACSFEASDLTAWCEAMRARGLQLATAPVEEDFGTYAEAIDPDGRVVVFRETPAAATLEEELAEPFEDDGIPQRAAFRKPVKKGSRAVSMVVNRPSYKSKGPAKRRRPSGTTRSVVSVRGAGPDHARLRPKKTADEKKARVKPGMGRLRKAEQRSSTRRKSAAASASKSRPVKRASANAARRGSPAKRAAAGGARRGGR